MIDSNKIDEIATRIATKFNPYKIIFLDHTLVVLKKKIAI